MLYPLKATEVVKPLLVRVVGRAIGELFEDAILASLVRLVPRWVGIAEHELSPEALLDETKPLVHYDQLVKAAPIDRAARRSRRRGHDDGSVAREDHAAAAEEAQALRLGPIEVSRVLREVTTTDVAALTKLPGANMRSGSSRRTR